MSPHKLAMANRQVIAAAVTNPGTTQRKPQGQARSLLVRTVKSWQAAPTLDALLVPSSAANTTQAERGEQVRRAVAVVRMAGQTVLLATAGALLWLRGRARPGEAT
jgi:hypothetical protein